MWKLVVHQPQPTHLVSHLPLRGGADVAQVIAESNPPGGHRQRKVEHLRHVPVGVLLGHVSTPVVALGRTPVAEFELLPHSHVAPVGYPQGFVVLGDLECKQSAILHCEVCM